MTLEELLNKCIQRGWKPFWWKDIKRANNEWWFVCFVHKSKRRPWLSEVSHRELVSKESNLWQFCVENDLIDYSKVRAYWISFAPIDTPIKELSNYDNVHRLLRDCASLDEDKLEEFLLNNIKIDE